MTAPVRGAGRPASVTLLANLLVFQGLSALAGGTALLAAPRGSPVFPLALLEGSPFATFHVPGLLLFVLLGLGPLAVAWAVAVRPARPSFAPIARAFGSHWAWPAAGAVGVALVVFLAIEAAMIGLHALQLVYGLVGAGIVAATLMPGTRRYLRT